MSTTRTHHSLWVAYGPSGVVGSIRKEADRRYAVTMAGADSTAGEYPTMEIAKNALHARLKPGSAWPQFFEH